MGEKDGIKAALEATDAAALARENAVARADIGTQAELFAQGAAAAANDERLDAQLPIAPQAPRMAGRPKGARNRRTDEVAGYVAKRFGDPLIGLASIAFRPTADLIEELQRVAAKTGLPFGKDATQSVMGVLELQRKAMEALLPYIHAKRASVDDKGNEVVPVINIGRFEGRAASGAGGLSAEDFVDWKDVTEQALSEDEGEPSDDDASDEQG